MGEQRTSKVTISLPTSLLRFADALAQERLTTRSRIVAELLKKEEEAKTQALMAEGYREMAEENQRLAEEAYPVVAETILRSTRWDEQDGPEG